MWSLSLHQMWRSDVILATNLQDRFASAKRMVENALKGRCCIRIAQNIGSIGHFPTECQCPSAGHYRSPVDIDCNSVLSYPVYEEGGLADATGSLHIIQLHTALW